MKKILIVLSLCSTLCGCSYVNRYFGFQDDNMVEESAEELLRMRTGIDIDLTPATQEKGSFKA